MAKRINGLDEQTSADNTWVVEVDDNTNTITESEKMTLEDVISIGGGLLGTNVSDVTLSYVGGGQTITTNIGKRYQLDNALIYVIDLEVNFSSTQNDPGFEIVGPVDPGATLATSSCSVNTVGSLPSSQLYPCALTNLTPIQFTVYGSFASGVNRRFRFTLTTLK